MTKILGTDEAGRGPVIGPLIIAGVMIDDSKQTLPQGLKDSKLLSHIKRMQLDKQIKENSSFEILEVLPKEIDEALLSDSMNLNWLEAHKQAEIINTLKPEKAIIDCPSPNIKKFTEYLKNLLKNKNIELIVEHKADMKYQICSAASIIAKVKREEEMDKIKLKYGKTGAGYPSDPKTKEFVKNNWNKHPEIFRKTWATYKKYSDNKGQKGLNDF